MAVNVFGIGAETELFDINSVEGKTMSDVQVKHLLHGENGLLLEVHIKKGTVTPAHTHEHESLCYILKGRVRQIIGDEVRVLGPGDAFLHPVGVVHVGEILEDTVWLEVKAPPEITW